MTREYDRELQALGHVIRERAASFVADCERGDEYDPRIDALLAQAKGEGLLDAIRTKAEARDRACDIIVRRMFP